MYIEILDIHAAKPITIEGPRSLGREGGPADIPVPDERVSSMHARIYPQAGRWFIEDTDSSNGTFVKGEQVTKAVELEEGMSFALCEYTFQVLRIVEAGGAPKGPVLEPSDTEAELSRPSISMGIPPSNNGSAGESSVSLSGVSGDDVEKQPFGEIVSYQLTGVPKAFGYYLAATPKIAVNPLGTVKKNIADQSFPAFGTKEIVAYAIPPLLLMLVILQLGAIIVALVNETFGAGTIITPLVMTAVFIVSAFVTGFLMHPILRWLVRILGGQSDARSRTNYFITAYSAVPLAGLGSGVAAVLSVIHVPYIGVLTPILQLYAGLIMLFVVYAWFKYFQVHKVVPIIVLVLMGLTGLGTVAQIAQVVRTGGGGAGSVTVATDDPQVKKSPSGTRATPKTGTTAAPNATATPQTVAGRSSFQEYKRRREAILTAIGQEPPLLKLEGVAPLYQEMLKRSYAVEAHYPYPKKPQTPEAMAKAEVARGLIEADTYRDTVDLVDRLYPLVIRD